MLKTILFSISGLFLVSKTALGAPCDSLFTPIECKTQISCTYDHLRDVCMEGPEQCEPGYIQEGSLCALRPCPTDEQGEHRYLDKWSVIVLKPARCAPGLKEIRTCEINGEVSIQTVELAPLPSPHDCADIN